MPEKDEPFSEFVVGALSTSDFRDWRPKIAHFAHIDAQECLASFSSTDKKSVAKLIEDVFLPWRLTHEHAARQNTTLAKRIVPRRAWARWKALESTHTEVQRAKRKSAFELRKPKSDPWVPPPKFNEKVLEFFLKGWTNPYAETWPVTFKTYLPCTLIEGNESATG